MHVQLFANLVTLGLVLVQLTSLLVEIWLLRNRNQKVAKILVTCVIATTFYRCCAHAMIVGLLVQELHEEWVNFLSAFSFVTLLTAEVGA